MEQDLWHYVSTWWDGLTEEQRALLINYEDTGHMSDETAALVLGSGFSAVEGVPGERLRWLPGLVREVVEANRTR